MGVLFRIDYIDPNTRRFAVHLVRCEDSEGLTAYEWAEMMAKSLTEAKEYNIVEVIE